MTPPEGPRSGDRLPPLTLPRTSGDGTVALRGAGRGARVVYFPPEEEDAAARGYREALESSAIMERWLAGLLVVGGPGQPGAGPPIARAVDPDASLRRRLGLDPAAAALLVADRWGVLYLAEAAGHPGDLPELDELSDSLKYIATQCPECGVPDEPGRGEWAAT